MSYFNILLRLLSQENGEAMCDEALSLLYFKKLLPVCIALVEPWEEGIRKTFKGRREHGYFLEPYEYGERARKRKKKECSTWLEMNVEENA